MLKVDAKNSCKELYSLAPYRGSLDKGPSYKDYSPIGLFAPNPPIVS